MPEIDGLDDLPTVSEADQDIETTIPDRYSGLAGLVQNRFEQAELQKQRFDESRWLKAYRNYRGVYDSSVQFHSNERSRVFVKITKTKVLAGYGRLLDEWFGTGGFPISLTPTPVPDGVAEYVHLETGEKQEKDPEPTSADAVGYDGDGRDMPPGATAESLFGSMSEKFGEEDLNWVEGESNSPEQPQVSPALIAAKNMERVILDQLKDGDAEEHIRKSTFEMCLLGTGIIKGPFSYNKTDYKWTSNDDGERDYEMVDKLVPRIKHVSIWDFYPDPLANSSTDMEWAIERHKLNITEFKNLSRLPFFDKEAIRQCIEDGGNFQSRSFEDQLTVLEGGSEFTASERYEVLEYWGNVDKATALEAGIDLPEDWDELTDVQINAWVCGETVLRVVINPFTPARVPYLVCPYEENPYQFFGVGISENMEDSQTIINGHTRMAIDNLGLAGNVVLDVDDSALVPGQDMSIYAGKIFRRQTGQPGQSIYAIKFPNTAPENMDLVRTFKQFADEETGIPSFSHGQTNVSGTGRTASGMSMLMGASSINTKTVIKNADNYWFKPLGDNSFSWNMQFNEDELDIKGDVDIEARGSIAMLQKEVLSQRLLMFAQTAAGNPNLAPMVKWPALAKKLAEVLDIDPRELVNSPEEAAIQAALTASINAKAGGPAPDSGQPGAMGQDGKPPPGTSPADATGSGGGTIGTGAASAPGESSFAASTPPTPGNS